MACDYMDAKTNLASSCSEGRSHISVVIKESNKKDLLVLPSDNDER